MKILAIETSCDDTGISIVKTPKNKRGRFKVLSNIVSSQIEVHKKYGGVYPAMAKREHQNNLIPTFKKALKKAELLKISKKSRLFRSNRSNRGSPIESGQISGSKNNTLKEILNKERNLYENLKKFLEKYEKPDIDLIAVTQGPGLEPCLWVGVNFARALSFFWDIKIVPVNHIESHILVNYLKNNDIKFPAVCLIVSGGHTQLILMKGIGKYQILGETRDDAAGECFDKTAKILGLGYPGGPVISQLAKNDRKEQLSIKLPRPMINTKDYDFSFSGLKTAVLYHHKKQSVKTQKSKEYIAQMCAEIQQAIIDVLIKKTMKAVKDYNAKIPTTESPRIHDKIGTIILGGGVSANQELRRQFVEKIQKEIPNTKYLIPNTALSTDNALMIAITGYFYKAKTKDWKKLEAKANLRIE
ncbi:MAG: tRNA (adenosine(37)-N6)-threonylcarbamoyltransferase complex transferase subunit TsaD [Candidatus Staskawiczbacteria bacterium]|nr:tRNA (adenosine(37)-N6)-threonylcarbamoyltransferase complex transferase subunit TsaD [Candidatus Staskawiczbacteria bacterium]